MALPIPANTTCDIYRTGNSPPAAPDVAAVPCVLLPSWRVGQDSGERNNPALTWTHVMLLEPDVDLRDGYTGQSTISAQDTLYVPDQDGTGFTVIFIELVQRGEPHAHKRAYLDRVTPAWPTDEL